MEEIKSHEADMPQEIDIVRLNSKTSLKYVLEFGGLRGGAYEFEEGSIFYQDRICYLYPVDYLTIESKLENKNTNTIKYRSYAFIIDDLQSHLFERIGKIGRSTFNNKKNRWLRKYNEFNETYRNIISRGGEIVLLDNANNKLYVKATKNADSEVVFLIESNAAETARQIDKDTYGEYKNRNGHDVSDFYDGIYSIYDFNSDLIESCIAGLNLSLNGNYFCDK